MKSLYPVHKKNDNHNITEILLKVTLNTRTLTLSKLYCFWNIIIIIIIIIINIIIIIIIIKAWFIQDSLYHISDFVFFIVVKRHEK